MGLKNIDIKISYAGKGNEILKNFLLPSINESIRYDRVTSFYTVESLLAISQGIESLHKKQGRMRLIIGIHSMPEEFVDAVTRKKHLKNQIAEIRNNPMLSNSYGSLLERMESYAKAIEALLAEPGDKVAVDDVIVLGEFIPGYKPKGGIY